MTYTTPSGHVYEEPTTVDEIRTRATTYGQGLVECWVEAELPPPPTWRMIDVLLQAVDGPVDEYARARLRLAQLLDDLTVISVHPDRPSVNGATMFRRVFDSVRAFIDQHETQAKENQS